MTDSKGAHLNIAATSHPGVAGKKNEDRYGVSSFLTGPQGDLPAVLAVLCDGIGGHRAGEVAAQMGVTLITEEVTASDGSQPLITLEKAIKRANHAIYEASLSDQGRKGMGSTCACTWVIGDRLFTANLGDSRIYLFREGHILQLTTDHTWLQEAFDAGIIDEAQGETHPNAHVIRRYLGSPKALHPDFRLWFFEGEGDADALDNQGLLLEAGDILLVCSDGLTDLVTDEEILAVVTSNPLAASPGILLDLANARGGHDNITVVLMGIPASPEAKIIPMHRRRRLIGYLVGLIVIGLLAAAIFLGLRWREQGSDLPAASPPAVTQMLPTQTPGTVQMTITHTPPAKPTFTLESGEGLSPTFATITPWPTHTLAP